MVTVLTYKEAMAYNKKLRKTKEFITFREFTGNWQGHKDLKLPSVADINRRYFKDWDWDKSIGENYQYPWGWLGNENNKSSEEIYNSIRERAIVKRKNGRRVIASYFVGYKEACEARGVDISHYTQQDLVVLFFAWMAGTVKGIEIEAPTILALNSSSAAKKGWVFERADGDMEAEEVDAIGTKDGKQYFISIKNAGGAFSVKCINEYRDMGKDKPHYYINEKLQMRKADNLEEVIQIT